MGDATNGKNPPKSKDNRNATKPEQRASRRAARHTVDAADWSSADPQLLAGCIIAVSSADCAIQFGLTRDGGALVIRIVGDGPEAYNEYVRPSEDTNLYLQGLLEDFSNRSPSDRR